MKKYALFIGRWQNWHKGHEWLINQQLTKGKNIWIAIRDIQPNENNTKSPHKVMMDLMEEDFIKENIDKILISIIPDIESVNYGRAPQYEVIYHNAPKEISDINGIKYIDSNGDVIVYNIDKK
jgi:nicotinamide mononucleotide adenylyltransferase